MKKGMSPVQLPQNMSASMLPSAYVTRAADPLLNPISILPTFLFRSPLTFRIQYDILYSRGKKLADNIILFSNETHVESRTKLNSEHTVVNDPSHRAKCNRLAVLYCKHGPDQLVFWVKTFQNPISKHLYMLENLICK